MCCSYCLELHNQAVKALRYPPSSDKAHVESIEEQREREQQVKSLLVNSAALSDSDTLFNFYCSDFLYNLVSTPSRKNHLGISV